MIQSGVHLVFRRGKVSLLKSNINSCLGVVKKNFETCLLLHDKKRELNRRLIYECRCDERLKVKDEGSTRLTYTGFLGRQKNLILVRLFISRRIKKGEDRGIDITDIVV